MSITDSLLDPGLNLGSYTPGANVYTNFAVQVAQEGDFHCGRTTLGINLVARSSTGEASAGVKIDVDRRCP